MGIVRARLGGLAVLGWLIALVLPVGAATFTVDSTADQVDVAPGNGVCATASNVCTLRAAVMEANATPGGDSVNLPAGTFRLSPTGTNEDAGETGDLDVTDGLAVAGAGTDQTVIDGSGADRVFDVVNGSDFSLANLTVRRGSPAGADGGGVRHPGPGSLTITGVRFERNHAGSGAAIYHAGWALAVTGGTFEDNVAGYSGGAIYKTGPGPITVSGAAFTNNVGGGPGGAIACDGSDTVSIADSQFVANSGGGGGAVAVNASNGLGIQNCTFQDSQSSGNGGAVSFAGPGGAVITNGTFTGGVAGGSGGALFVDAGTDLEVHVATFTDNLAGYSGGALSFYSPGGGAAISDATFTGNGAFGGPGGAFAINATGPVSLGNLEVRGNSSEDAGGGAAVSAGAATISAVKFRDNIANNNAGGGLYANVGGAGTIANATFSGNLVGDGDGGGLELVGTGPFEVQGCTFSGNAIGGADAQGGGLLVASGEQSHLLNVTISGNSSAYRGGGLYVGGDVTAYSTTFSGNTAGEGGAVYNGSVFRIGNTILAGSGGGNCAGNQVDSGNRNIDADGSCMLDGPSDQANVDPQLGPLAENGGPTATHALALSSPAVDSGNPSVCPATDQRGIARPVDGNGDGEARCDIGAYEYFDQCPGDPKKVDPGACGCGSPDADDNGNGVADCLANAELKARIAQARETVALLTTERSPAQKALRADLKRLAAGLTAYVKEHKKGLVLADPAANLSKLAKLAAKGLKAARRAKGGKLDGARERAAMALTHLDDAVAPQ